MDRPKLEVADVFRRYGEAYCQKHGASLSMAQRRVMTAIELCRTAVLGGHLEQCDQCGHQRNAYNSCSDRHCPKCQSLARARWLEDRQFELLDTQYFHVVFTVPERIATIVRPITGLSGAASTNFFLTRSVDLENFPPPPINSESDTHL
jgi:hypothetical protein